MKLVTEKIQKKLIANNRDQRGKKPPVLKIFNPAGSQTWLIHSANPEEPVILFGICDLGMGFAELESIETLFRIGPFAGSTKLERDRYFRPTHSLEVYAQASHQLGRIAERLEDLDRILVR